MDWNTENWTKIRRSAKIEELKNRWVESGHTDWEN